MELRPLTMLDPAELGLVITGYTSPARYRVELEETPALTTFRLVWEALPQPHSNDYAVALSADNLALCRAMLPAGFSLAAYEQGQMAAVAIAEPHSWNRTLSIWEFHVALAFRRQGIGRLVMEALAEKAGAAGLRALVVETQNTNVSAITFYRSVGFKIEGVDISYYTNQDLSPQGEVAVFMKRRLQEGN